MVDTLPLFYSADPLTFFKDYFTPTLYWTFRESVFEKGFRIMLLVAGIAGIGILFKNREKDLSMVFMSVIIVFILITYFGSLVPQLRGFQLLRFKAFLNIALLYAAACCLITAFSRHRADTSKRFVMIIAVFGITTFLFNLYQTESAKAMKLRTVYSQDMKGIFEWIKNNTTPDARILFEESGDETGHMYDGMYFSSLIAHQAERQLVGGPSNLYNDIHYFASFTSGRLFKRDISDFSPDELKSYFETYNIGYIICFHPESLNALSGLKNKLTLRYRAGPFHCFKVLRRANWFLKGEGNVRASFNRIHCSNVRGDQVILKYHWNKHLIADDPGIRILEHEVLDDPVPFIKINHPPEEFSLTIGKR
jgi:hypothetical protein